MPFSWKKTARCNRFSKLVADHLQSPKRGGSLVVETGFPTSLIDLYVRNRGRFRKSKKQRENDSPTPLSSCSSSSSSGLLVDSLNITSSSSSSLYSLVESNNLSSGGTDHRGTDEIIEEEVDVGVDMIMIDDSIKDFTETEVEMSVEMAKLNPLLVVALKVLVMFVLVLGTKEFRIAITISAFVLLFMESMGKLLLGRSNSVRSTEDSKTLSESSVQVTKNIKSSEENSTPVCNKVMEIEEQIESNQEIRSDKYLDEVRSEVLMEIKHKSSRRAIMRSRMKKLVPKKLRRSSMGSKEEISYRFIEETVKSAQDDKASIDSSECSYSKGETLRIFKQNQNKNLEIERRSLSSSLSSEIDCTGKESERELHQNSGCFVLCLIVLVGLIGGRIMALVLALSWCLILKKLQWRNVKFPIS
ncbi:hypothetical protein R6Q59_025767 [Mikania micrantha]|uniref:Uncharacterized protein n=1 Tax=Mikania micrantha TaxID=192012 RepID=A0A5N6PDF3_9ASTR|nr:hypothetical protein E3N88_11030 [Mikania micrantha]